MSPSIAGTTTEEETAPEPLSTEQKRAVGMAAKAFTMYYHDAQKAYKHIAKAIVSLRLTFQKDGKPDFRGETPQYRGAVADLYESAIPDPDERSSFKVSIRYWVSKEYTRRVESKEIKKGDLEAAGIMKPIRPRQEQEPRRPIPSNERTGLSAKGKALRPAEVLAEAERIVKEHVTNGGSLGPVVALQSVAREMGPIVAALRDPDVKLPGRSLKAAAEHVLQLALDAAELAGLEVEDSVAEWAAEAAEKAAA